MPAQVKLYVVRHADAGSRSAWDGDDALRPLSKKGRRQSAGLADLLAGGGIARVVSSPAVRCVETLVPLAERLGLTVETDWRLAEGNRGDDALAVADELMALGEVAVVCSHGDVIPDLLSELRIAGTTFRHDLTWPKASVWVVSSNGSRWKEADFLPAPGS
jgi:broad specificity phosphatase PhoE